MRIEIRDGVIELEKSDMASLLYCGTVSRLYGKRALVRIDELPDSLMAQFDDMDLPEAYGWRRFGSQDFCRQELCICTKS